MSSLPPPPPQPGAEVLRLFERLDTVDYYELLGLHAGVDYLRVREAHGSTKQRLSPSRFEGDKHEKTREQAQTVCERLDEALNVLGDPWLRPRYDKLRAQGQKRANEEILEQIQPIHAMQTSPYTRHYLELAREKMQDERAQFAIMDMMLALSCDDPPSPRVVATHDELVRTLKHQHLERTG